ncbi:transposase [Novosphingobium sp. Leaf2]|uniref:transposase n=1 Tax=Novosphingobium sp. Leaf2 TaxID=1735670 RepID=UPI00138F3949|nr:transposase [Novosphingobium sp. Leaf2]
MIGLPERAPEALLADKGYDADTIRADLAERNIEAVIPGRSNRRVKIEHDRPLYNQRNRTERMFGHLKINRAIATRYGQLANSFLSMVHLATIRYWIKFFHAAEELRSFSVLRALMTDPRNFPARRQNIAHLNYDLAILQDIDA